MRNAECPHSQPSKYPTETSMDKSPFREQEVINLTTIVWTAKKDTGLPDTRSTYSSCQQGQVSCGLWWAGLCDRDVGERHGKGMKDPFSTRVSIPQAPGIDSF